MALGPGSKLGVYEVTAKIGAGGMGEVYRAHDTTLDRDVAIKVLPDAFATDPERLARFERDAPSIGERGRTDRGDHDWSADGAFITYATNSGVTDLDIWMRTG